MDLWSYGLADLVPFSRETYLRLFERYQVGVWPASLVGWLLGLATLVALRRPGQAGARVALLIVAAAWLWVGLVFQMRWFAPLTWAGRYLGIAFVLQGALLGLAIGAGTIRRPSVRAGWDYGAGLLLLGLGVLIQPALGLLAGHPWEGLETFGTAPDPTVVATLGLLLMLHHPWRWLLAAIPILWCLVSGAMLSVLGLPTWPVLPLVALSYLVIAAWQWGSDLRAARR